MTMYAQGDILLIRIGDEAESLHEPEQPIVLAEGEVTGHKHAVHGGAMLFRDDAQARAIPDDLYIGTLRVGKDGADLRHEEHAAIALRPGRYEVRRQREYHAGMARVVED